MVEHMTHNHQDIGSSPVGPTKNLNSMTQIKLKCINCENHALYDMACNIKNPNYEKRLDPSTDLSNCFITSKLHTSLDNVIRLTDELIKKIK